MTTVVVEVISASGFDGNGMEGLLAMVVVGMTVVWDLVMKEGTAQGKDKVTLVKALGGLIVILFVQCCLTVENPWTMTCQ